MSKLIPQISLASPTLSLSITHPIVFVRPNANPSLPTHDPIFSGTVSLNLPKERQLKELRVRLKNVADVAFGVPMDPSITNFVLMEKELKIDLGGADGVKLSKGVHTWEFSFIVPSSIAPYERCNFGRVYSRIYARASFPGLGRKLEASTKIDVVANPMQEAETPGQFDLRIDDFNRDIGIFRLHYESPHFTVAGLLHFHFSIPEPPQRLTFEKLELFILQQHTLRRPRKSDKEPESPPVIPPPQRRKIFAAEGGEIHRGWKLSRWIRLPNSNILRCTTQPGTQTPISNSHELSFEFTYRVPDPKDPSKYETKILTVKKDVTLLSCLFMIDNVLTPPYEGCCCAVQPATLKPYGGPFCTVQCFCTVSTEEMMKGKEATLAEEEFDGELESLPAGRRRKWEWENGIESTQASPLGSPSGSPMVSLGSLHRSVTTESTGSRSSES
ncbi:hypothetical protein BT69DRAFT_1318831 [Atractiella rhizophila]|nr:hypothetical protein BT69DRAFT_1318831 [Atractiella rhizophila]